MQGIDRSTFYTLPVNFLARARGKAAAKWSGGLVNEARASAFDKAYHPGNNALIGTGHTYMGADQAAVLNIVFANIQSFRRGAARPA